MLEKLLLAATLTFTLHFFSTGSFASPSPNPSILTALHSAMMLK